MDRLEPIPVAKCYWRSSGQHRHIAVECKEEVTTDLLRLLNSKCLPRGWKALPGRSWSLRQRHRLQKRAPTVVRGSVLALSNRYAAIEVDAEPGKTGEKQDEKKQDEKKQDEEKQVSIKCGSLNVNRALGHKIAELEAYFRRYSYDIIFLQEHGVKIGQPAPKMQGYVSFPETITESAQSVLIYVRSNIAHSVHALKQDRKDQVWIRVPGAPGKRALCLCSAYMPQESDAKEVRKQAFNLLEEAIQEYSAKGECAVFGDLNAKTGKPLSDLEAAMLGKFGQRDQRSGNGKLLVNVLLGAEMTSLLGQRPPPYKTSHGNCNFWYTRLDPIHGTKNQIDYALVSRRLAALRPKSWVDYTHLGSDHHLVGASIPYPRSRVRHQKQQIMKSFHYEKLIRKSSRKEDVDATLEEVKLYHAAVEEAFQGFDASAMPKKGSCSCPHDDCACSLVMDFVRRTDEVLAKSIGPKVICRKFSRSWFDDNAKKAVTARRVSYAAYLQCPSGELWKKFQVARSSCTKIIRRNKAEDWAKFLDGFGEDYRNSHKQLWQRVRKLVPSSAKATLAPIKRQDGSLALTEEEILDAWADHYEALGRPEDKPEFDKHFARSVAAEVDQIYWDSWGEECRLGEDFLAEDIEEVLESLDDNKAAAEDRTKNTAFKRGGPRMVSNLLALFNTLNRKEHLPANWASALVVNLYKDGDKTDAGNYRGISLISCLGKIYLSLWAKRLSRWCEGQLHDEQGGFRARRSTIDDALALKEILLKRLNQGKKTYLLFIDYRKAFDTVWHDGLWKRLWDLGIRGKPWRIIRQFYAEINAAVRLGGKVSRRFRILQGVRQGCPLSPTLFDCFIDELVRRLNEAGVGIDLAMRVGKLCSLLYADDVVLMAESVSDLQKMLDVVEKFSGDWRMDLNLKKGKTEVMVVGAKKAAAPPVLFFRGAQVNVTDKYKYLGIWFTSSLTWDHHIDYMVDRASKRTGELRAMIRNPKIPVRAKLLVWSSYVRPLLEYGSEVWEANSKQDAKISAVQQQALTKIMKLNVKTRGTTVLALAKTQSLITRRKKARLNYLGKLLTQDFDRISRCVIFEDKFDYRRAKKTAKPHWKTSTIETINGDLSLKVAYGKLLEALNRNGGILPSEEEPMIQGSFPLKAWCSAVDDWATRSTIASIKGTSDSVAIITRGLKFREKMPVFTVTKRANKGADQLRIRLLSGTSGLNATQAKVGGGRGESCVHGCAVKETAVHFLLHCPHYKSDRERYLERLAASCVPKSHKRRLDDPCEVTCFRFFNKLSDVGKALFMLGGPVQAREDSDPWTPDYEVDAAAMEYVTRAYKKRSEKLDAERREYEARRRAPEPVVIDLTIPNRPQRKITEAFAQVGISNLSTQLRQLSMGAPDSAKSAHTQHDQFMRNRHAQHERSPLPSATAAPEPLEGSGSHSPAESLDSDIATECD